MPYKGITQMQRNNLSLLSGRMVNLSSTELHTVTHAVGKTDMVSRCTCRVMMLKVVGMELWMLLKSSSEASKNMAEWKGYG